MRSPKSLRARGGGQEADPSPCAVHHRTTSSPCVDFAALPPILSRQQEAEVEATLCGNCRECYEWLKEKCERLTEQAKRMREELSKKKAEYKAQTERLSREFELDVHSPTSLTSREEQKDDPWPSPELDAMIKSIADKLEELTKKHNIEVSQTADLSQLQIGSEDKLTITRALMSMVLAKNAEEGYMNATAYSAVRGIGDMLGYGLEGKEMRQEEGRDLSISSTNDDTPASQSSRSQRTVDRSDPLLAPVSVQVRKELPTVDDPAFAAFSPAVRTFCSAIGSGEIPERVPPEIEELTGPFVFLRLWLQHHGYFGVFSKETAHDIARNVGGGTVLDPLAGAGWAVKALREAGVRTIGSDKGSDHDSESHGQFEQLDAKGSDSEFPNQFEQLDAMDALKKYGDQITHLLISWAPHGSDIDARLLREVGAKYPHVTIINVGEDRGGCTGSAQFWREAKEVTPSYPVRYRRTAGIYDKLTFLTWAAPANEEYDDGRDQCIVC